MTEEALAPAETPKSITRKWVEGWVAQHAPHLTVYEAADGRKGYYSASKTPAASFVAVGATWREVAVHLGAIARPGADRV